MAKRSQRRAGRFEKDQAGCMWGLISIFDFRYGRSTRKLLSDRKRGNRHAVVSKDDGYPNTEIKMLSYSDEKCQTIEDRQESEMAADDAVKTSVKELMEKEMFSEQGLKNNMNSADVQLNSGNGGHVRGNPKQAKRIRSKSCDVNILDLDGAGNSSHQVSDQKAFSNLDLEAMLDEICRLNQSSTGCLKHDWHDEVEMESNQVYSLFEEKFGAAIKVFISQRFTNDKHIIEDGKTNHSKEFVDALQTLSSNKELFLELLQDPNSLLVKHIQSLKQAKLDKDQNINPLAESNLLKEESSKPRPDELIHHKRRRFFRRRSKSQDCTPPRSNESCQTSSRIVILKPGPAALQNSDTESSITTSVQSRHTMNNKPESERNASQFSFSEIKRKLKHAMRKEQHGISPNDITHRFPPELENLKNRGKGVGEGNGGWSSPNRNHFYTERFAKYSTAIKIGDKKSKLKDSETTISNETTENSKQGISNIYFEAKKHLSEMLSNGDEKEELMGRQLPKSLGRILSLPEYSFTPSVSPGKDRDQIRLSPRSNFQMINENTWRLVQNNHAIQLSPSKQTLENQSCNYDDKLEEKVQSPKSDHDIAYKVSQNDSVEDTISSTKEEGNCSEEVLDSARAATLEILENIVMDASCESSSCLFSREIQSCDTAEVCNEEKSPQCMILDSVEENECSSPPSVTTPSPSVTRKVENLDSTIDKAERPSPISVLQPLFPDDNISPSSTISEPVSTTIQPVQINFEERVSSDADQAIFITNCMEDEESAFEYVEAVLLGSGLNWDEFYLRWISCDNILDPSLFDEVELFSSRSSHDQKLLFDCANKVLKEVCDRYFSCSLVKQHLRPAPRGMSLINEVWEGVEWHLLQHPPPHSLDQLMRKDMSKTGTWMDLHFETDHVVRELENSILEEMLNDAISRFVEGKSSLLSTELIEDESRISV